MKKFSFLLVLLCFTAIHSVFSNGEMCLGGETGEAEYNTCQHQDDYKMAFSDPALANLILKELDIFEPHYGTFTPSWGDKNYQKPFLGLTSDDEYCNKQRAYWTQNPSYVFTQNNYMSSYGPTHFARRFAIDQIATNVMPNIQFKKNYTDPPVDISPEVMLFITGSTMHNRRHLMKQFSCMAQMSNHIAGHSSLYQKDLIALGSNEYYKGYETRKQCIKQFFPTTYVLSNKEQCQQFFNIIDSDEYKQLKKEHNIVYISKIVGMHAGSGVTPMDEKEELNVRTIYANGKKCGEDERRMLVQSFVRNPMLINGKKSDFRLYMLVASTNPFIVFYHDGYFRISFTDYDPHSTEKSSLVTNSAISPELHEAKETGMYNGRTYQELKEEQSWLFEKLQAYLLEKGMITDQNWVDNYLRPECKKAMIHLIRASQKNFIKRSTVFELFGVDFMLDDQLNLWFTEANAMPGLSEKNEILSKFEGQMLRDEFDIIFRLLRSRMKRIFNYVSRVIARGDAVRIGEDKVEIKDLQAHIEEFREISKNRFEPEYEPLADSTFTKIIDENYSGTQRYSGLLSEECL